MIDAGIYCRSNPVQVQSLNNIDSQAPGNSSHHSVCVALGFIQQVFLRKSFYRSHFLGDSESGIQGLHGHPVIEGIRGPPNRTRLPVVVVEPKLWAMADGGIYCRSNPVQV